MTISMQKKIMNYILFILSFLSATTLLYGQTNITWKTLSDVEINPQLFPEESLTYDVPTFGEELRSLHEKEVTISGYLIPLNNQDQLFVLSKNPYASCFFCGGAGPESVMELWLKPESFRRFQLDELVQFKGTLLLNGDDFDHCMYILKDAVEVL